LARAEADVAAAGDDDAPRRVAAWRNSPMTAADVRCAPPGRISRSPPARGVNPRGHAAARHGSWRPRAPPPGQMRFSSRSSDRPGGRRAGPHPHQAPPCPSAKSDLQRAGMIDETLDGIGHQLLFFGGLRTHLREALGAEPAPRGWCNRPRGCARSWSGCETAERHRAGHHVDLVVEGERDDDVGIGGARVLEH